MLLYKIGLAKQNDTRYKCCPTCHIIRASLSNIMMRKHYRRKFSALHITFPFFGAWFFCTKQDKKL